MRIFLGWIVVIVALFLLIGWIISGPSDAEIDATHDAQCTRWGAKHGTAEYIQCRATLQVNYQREQRDESNSAAAGIAIGMAAGAAANSGARR
jgi:hypothetical protein